MDREYIKVIGMTSIEAGHRLRRPRNMTWT